MRTGIWFNGLLRSSGRKSCCFLLCCCLQLPLSDITVQSAWLSPHICLHACPRCSGLFPTFSIFPTGRRPLHLFGNLYFLSPLLSGSPNTQVSQPKHSMGWSTTIVGTVSCLFINWSIQRMPLSLVWMS